jgi:hypothetical protein
MRSNIFDNMLAMMEKYANNLEALVAIALNFFFCSTDTFFCVTGTLFAPLVHLSMSLTHFSASLTHFSASLVPFFASLVHYLRHWCIYLPADTFSASLTRIL